MWVFIKWCDEVTTGETSKSPPECVYPYPKCSCEAGVCKKIMLYRSPNAGRTCFVCRVPRVCPSLLLWISLIRFQFEVVCTWWFFIIILVANL